MKMKLSKLVEKLNQIKTIIVTTVVLIGMGWSGFTYFAPMSIVEAGFQECKQRTELVAGSIELLRLNIEIANIKEEISRIHIEYGYDPNKYPIDVRANYERLNNELELLKEEKKQALKS